MFIIIKFLLLLCSICESVKKKRKKKKEMNFELFKILYRSKINFTF